MRHQIGSHERDALGIAHQHSSAAHFVLSFSYFVCPSPSVISSNSASSFGNSVAFRLSLEPKEPSGATEIDNAMGFTTIAGHHTSKFLGDLGREETILRELEITPSRNDVCPLDRNASGYRGHESRTVQIWPELPAVARSPFHLLTHIQSARRFRHPPLGSCAK